MKLHKTTMLMKSLLAGIQSFLLMLGGLISGPLMDLGYFRFLVLFGNFMVVFGMMMIRFVDQS